ncbi:MAG: hypothetical protein IJB94_06615 [Clostridia bacterium]|nr:hypothetical protein [Clostridia bacterium]
MGEDLKLLFFDMEFANGKIPGSVFSFGYLMTDEEFNIVTPPADICINPDCKWNEYVAKNILAYPMETIEASPLFPDCYEAIKALFAEADIAVGFSVSNDVAALRQVCERYGLSPILYHWFDMEKLCRRADKHKEAHGLAGYVTAWCGQAPENQHRSDGDALATMHLMRAVCRDAHVDGEMLTIAYPECCGDTTVQNQPKKKKNANTTNKNGKKRRRPRHRKKKSATAADAPVEGETK